jgi:hypothetical protein
MHQPEQVRGEFRIALLEASKEPKRTWHGAMRVSTAAVSTDSRYTGASLSKMASAAADGLNATR